MDCTHLCSEENISGELVFGACSDYIAVWNCLGNSRHSIQYSAPVTCLTTFEYQVNDSFNFSLANTRKTATMSQLVVQKKLSNTIMASTHTEDVHQVVLIGTTASTVIASMNSREVAARTVGQAVREKETDHNMKETFCEGRESYAKKLNSSDAPPSTIVANKSFLSS